MITGSCVSGRQSRLQNPSIQGDGVRLLLSAISNPKVLLLFTAFITPFIDPHQDLLLQTVVMALTYAVVDFAVVFGVASAANRVRPWGRSSPASAAT